MSYTDEKKQIIRRIVIDGDKLKKYKTPYIKSIKLYEEVKQYNNILDWASDQQEYVKVLTQFREKKLVKN